MLEGFRFVRMGATAGGAEAITVFDASPTVINCIFEDSAGGSAAAIEVVGPDASPKGIDGSAFGWNE